MRQGRLFIPPLAALVTPFWYAHDVYWFSFIGEKIRQGLKIIVIVAEEHRDN